MPLPPTPITPPNHLKALDDRLPGGLVPEQFDEVDMSYTGVNLTQAVYKLAGNVVATVTLTYTGANLTKAVRT